MITDTKPLSDQPIPREFMERAAALRSAVIWQSNAANEIIARALMAEHGSGAIAPECSCLEILGEDPACPVHGRGTKWALGNPDIAELAGRSAVLTEWTNRLQAICEKHGALGGDNRLDFIERTLDAKDALLREAAEALAPFIPLADEIDQLGHEPGSTCLHRLKSDDLRRARSLLLKLTEATKP
jgi:hypothetical protein